MQMMELDRIDHAILRELQQDLKSYATNRRSGVERIEDTTLQRVQAQIRPLPSTGTQRTSHDRQ